MSIRKRTSRAALAMATALALGALAGCAAGTAEEGDVALKEVNLMYFPIPLSITELAAKENGFFKDEGLDVRLINATSGADAVKFIVAGSAYGQLASNALNLQAIDAGQPLVELGSIANMNPIEFTASEELGLPFDGDLEEKVQALKGKVVGVTGIGAATYIVAKSLLIEGGLSNPDEDVEFVAVGLATTAVEQLKAGRIDAYVAPAPFGPIAKEADAGALYIGADDFPPNMQPSAWLTLTTTQAQYDADPETAAAWCRAEIRGVEWVTDPENIDAVTELMSTLLVGQPDAVVKETTEFYLDFFATALEDWSVPRDAFDNDVALITGNGLQNNGDLSYDSVVLNVC